MVKKTKKELYILVVKLTEMLQHWSHTEVKQAIKKKKTPKEKGDIPIDLITRWYLVNKVSKYQSEHYISISDDIWIMFCKRVCKLMKHRGYINFRTSALKLKTPNFKFDNYFHVIFLLRNCISISIKRKKRNLPIALCLHSHDCIFTTVTTLN